MPDPRDLVGPGGKPLIKQKQLLVIKAPKGVKLSPALPGALSKETGCAVCVMPMDSEILYGDLAAEELRFLHASIHAATDLPAIDFQLPDLEVLYGALKYVCEKTQPGDGSAQVKLLKRIKAKLDSAEKKK